MPTTTCSHGQAEFCWDALTEQQQSWFQGLHAVAYDWAYEVAYHSRNDAEGYATWLAATYCDDPQALDTTPHARLWDDYRASQK